MKAFKKISIIVLVLLVVILISAALLFKTAGDIAKKKLEDALGPRFSVQRVEIGLSGIEAYGIVFKKDDGTALLSADRIKADIDYTGLLRRRVDISLVAIANPFLVMDSDTGTKVGPLVPQQDGKGGGAQEQPQISIKKFTIHGGIVEYHDRKVAEPAHVTKIENIEFELSDIRSPLVDAESILSFKAGIPAKNSTGLISLHGKINLKSMDLDCKLNVNGLDITHFKPYFQKKGDADVRNGALDLDIRAEARKRIIKAPGRATIKGLKFGEWTSLKDKFLGVPRSAVLGIMKDSKEDIGFNFIIEGDLSNPKFNLRENIMERITMGLAEKLGVSPEKMVRSIVTNDVTKSIGKGLQKIFK